MASKIMSKKEMIKEQQRLKKEKQIVHESYNKEDLTKNLVIITISVLLFLGVVYAGMNLLKGNWKLGKEELVFDDTIDKAVICGTILNQDDSEYYVLAYSFDEVNSQFYDNVISSYSGTIYKMNLDSGFNKACTTTDKAVISSDLTKLKLTAPTLLHIKNKKIDKSYNTQEDILKTLFSK